jgi:ribosomal protein S6--L-glutamate ligase
MHFLILSAVNQKLLQKAITDAGHTFDRIDPVNLQMYVSDRGHKFDEIIYQGEPIPRDKYNAVVPRVGTNRLYAERILKHFSESYGVYTLQTGVSINRVSDKFRTAQLLSGKGIRIPRQMYCRNLTEADIKKILERFGLPLIVKPVSSSKGAGVILLESEITAEMTLEYLHAKDNRFIVQEFIETRTEKAGAQDIRAIVLDGQVISAMKRIAPQGKSRANLSINAQGQAVELTESQKKMAVDAVAAVEGLTFAGVDVISKPDENGNTIDYLLELNSNPGSLIAEIVNFNHFEPVVKYLEEHAPSHKRTWEAIHEKRSLLPNGIEIRDISDAYHALENFVSRNYQHKDQAAFNKKVAELEKRWGENGQQVVKIALEILELQPVKRAYDNRIN